MEVGINNIMYEEVQMYFRKINELLILNEFEKQEVEHLLFELWDKGYEEGFEAARDNS